MAAVIQAKERQDTTRSETKQIRAAGRVPAVVYGKDKDPITVSVDSMDLLKKVRDEGRNAVFSLEVEGGKSLEAMLYDYQTDVIKNELTHVDFYLVDMSTEVDVEVSANIEGESKGEKEGGVMQQTMHMLNVRATPRNIPEDITIDANELEIGDSVTVGDLKSGKNFELLDDEDTTIVTVLPPQQEDVPEVGDEGVSEENAEPEVINEKSEDNEEEK
ncbi:50S ribosomal protein L25/general stress protein Ctc [Alkalibacillus almallahensis]|uniref:50S ribosomal protein L25/general stress protein Ctc n=1 Tax=Alkalibacillus almallahensis TaxID=1379154 RepID=UPI0014237A78|nr:50S ribosomal protein L25/general stress protein Ctc [Alkalibacillus almallahensis]NIK12707.1 large subunit ribosomal protein L25 [Alkalibacillus almallahensis]